MTTSVPSVTRVARVLEHAWARAGRLSPANRWVLGVYLATRLAVLAGIALAYYLDPRITFDSVAHRADGWWYLHIAEHGYGHTLHPNVADYHVHYSSWAFFPAYPLLVRLVALPTRLPFAATGYLVSLVVGALAVRAVYALGEEYAGTVAGRSAALLVAAWPGSVAFTLPYSEGLYVASAAAALTMLLRRRWLAAGVLGAVASATRATGVAVVVAAAAVAILAIVGRRDWSSLVAPVVAGLGACSFWLYGMLETGDPLVWRHAENLWHQRLDFSRQLLHRLVTYLPRRGPYAAGMGLDLVGVALVVVFLAAAVACRSRLTVALGSYAAVVLFLVVGYSDVGTRPRMLLGLLPAFVYLARWLPSRVVYVTSVVLAATLAIATFLAVHFVVP